MNIMNIGWSIFIQRNVVCISMKFFFSAVENVNFLKELFEIYVFFLLVKRNEEREREKDEIYQQKHSLPKDLLNIFFLQRRCEK